MKTSLAIVLIAAYAVCTGATGKNTLDQPAVSASCPTPEQVGPLHLYGLWHAEFEGLPQGATLLFEKHPEWAGSVSGTITRNKVKAQLAGDVDEGELTLEESLDGQHISANWLGTIVENSCGKEIKGTWNNASNNSSAPFVLRKLPGWQ